MVAVAAGSSSTAVQLRFLFPPSVLFWLSAVTVYKAIRGKHFR